MEDEESKLVWMGARIVWTTLIILVVAFIIIAWTAKYMR